MYTRTFYPEEDKINVPEKYDGNALREDAETPPTEEAQQPLRAPWDIKNEEEAAPSEAVMSRTKDSDGFLGGIFKKLSLSNIFGGLDIFRGGSFKLGSEEILIIGVALFLLFSRGGDKECAFMLLALLLIK